MYIYIHMFLFSGRVDFFNQLCGNLLILKENIQATTVDMRIAQIVEFPCPKKDHSAIEERTGHPNLTSAVCILRFFLSLIAKVVLP